MAGELITREERARREAALAAAPLFGAMSKRHRRELAGSARVREYADGERVVGEGQAGSSFFLILDGDVRVSAAGKRIGSATAGGFFGETSLLAPGPRTATVEAVGALRCLEVPGSTFRRLLREEPGLAITVAQVLATRLRDLSGYRPSSMERLFIYS